MKVLLQKKCEELIEERILSIQKGIEAIIESRNNETKSSAGDKYETGRAMMQMEEQKSKTQLARTNELKLLLQEIDPSKQSKEVGLGSLVICNQGKYFISVPLGKVSMDDEDYFCISMASPIGKIIRGKKKGDIVKLGERKIEILDVL